MDYIKPWICEEKVEENKKEFLALYDEYILPAFPGAQALREWICASDFFIAPASTIYHMCCRGGLCQHSLNVYKRLAKLIKADYGNNFEDELGVSFSEIVLIGLLHDLCKANTYSVEMRNVKDETTGKWSKEPYYKYNPVFEYGHGEKSVFIIQSFVPHLNTQVAFAIRYHQGASGNPNGQIKDDCALIMMEQNPIILYTVMADMCATYIEERREPK